MKNTPYTKEQNFTIVIHCSQLFDTPACYDNRSVQHKCRGTCLYYVRARVEAPRVARPRPTTTMTASGDATGAPREQFDIIYYVADLVFCLIFFFFAQYCKHGDERGGLDENTTTTTAVACFSPCAPTLIGRGPRRLPTGDGPCPNLVKNVWIYLLVFEWIKNIPKKLLKNTQ